ncbi:threonine aldolase family protein [Larsenimonas rhizosphaerae]|uniref:L-threonine aldolase n=1 Tax=Larsenimonas rhizosphaerae TaxID=2944682 RepID=A0AA42CSR7_9GAMM|nr:low specificity L-threonine aldolase [Larsenimonas rhizosphaerae]MCM2130145.1 low specificity L-threonine aldolase [Larsenimonas rhizosphaerae]MCX2522832.1 low specificity L-threonine aldolase [Larsenimonas rhizosphaerae]
MSTSVTRSVESIQKMPEPRFLASDNTSGICPEALAWFLKANEQDDLAYGNDEWTHRAADQFRTLFDTDCDVFFAFNGTAANSLSLAALCQSYHSVICHELAHIETDECGGPEFFSNGSKLLSVPGINGKLTPEGIREVVTRRNDIHYPRPRVISLTQSTEVGTVYSLNELRAIREVAREFDLRIHMDGARFANACASLGVTPAELTWQSGVDVLCFSGTKNGLALGEAILFFDHRLSEDFAYRCKQAGQLASKMRYISAPWLGLLENDVWLSNAAHANAMATRLAEGVKGLSGVDLMFPVQANAVFIELPDEVQGRLREQGWSFYTFIGKGGVRFVCSWNTSAALVDRLIDDIRNALKTRV